MAFRLYFMPKGGTGTGTDPYRPIHTDIIGSNAWTMMDYGFEMFCVVGGNFDATTDANLVALADVQALPFNLDQNMSAGAVTTAQTYLENRNLPADWVTTAFTYRRMLRIVLGMFSFFQRFHGIHGDVAVFQTGITLSTTVSQLPALAVTNLTATANSFGLDYSAVTGATTIRQLLKGMANQLQSMQFVITGVTI